MTQSAQPAQAVSTAGRVVNGSVIGLSSLVAGNAATQATGSEQIGLLAAGFLGIFLSTLSAASRQKLETPITPDSNGAVKPAPFWKTVLLQTLARVG